MNLQLEHETTTFIKKQFPIVLLCDQVSSPANIGSLFRISEGFGLEKIYFIGDDISLDSNRMSRTARSTQNKVPYQQHYAMTKIIPELQSQGYTFIGLEITEKSIPIFEHDFTSYQKIALVIGEESKGISENLLSTMSTNVHIPMYGTNSSMNVAMATGIALYEITKQLSNSNRI